MAIPKIRKEFKWVKDIPTKKALLFGDFDGKEYWVPRSICTLIKQKEGMVVATLAAFKFEEITGIEPEDMATSFVSMGGSPLDRHMVNCSLVLSQALKYYPEQIKQLQVMAQCRFNYINWDAGTGKTLASLTLAASYLLADLVDKIFILCPASLQGQWAEKAKEYYPEMQVTILSIEANSFSTSLPKMLDKFQNVTGRKHLIVDESHMVKNLGAKRTKNIDKYYKADCVTCCTASSIGRNASDLYYQYSLSDRAIIGQENFNGFAKHFLLFGGQDGDRVVAYQNTKQLSERIAPYTFFLSKKEIRNDMPTCHHHKVYYEMDMRQKKAYGAINGLISQIQSRSKSGYIPKEKTYQITSFLQKISCGFVPDENELKEIFGNLGLIGEAAENVSKIKEISFEHENLRIKEVKKITDKFSTEQAIIWCSYRDELNALSDVYSNSRQFTGGMTLKSIQSTIKDFKDGKFQHLIAMQQMGTGFDLPWVNHAIYSTTVFDWIKRLQSEERINRINRQGDCHIYDVIATGSIDERVQQVLDYKQEITSIFNGQNSNSTR
jgi:superfamily II DNA or RNA helicase